MTLTTRCRTGPVNGRSRSRRAGDGVRGEGVVVGQAVLVSLLQLLREGRVLALGPLYARALLRIGVPSVPVLPPSHLPRLPRQRIRVEGNPEMLAVGGEHPRGVLGEGHGVYHRDVLPVHLRGVPEEVVDLLEARLLEGKVRPHLVERGYDVLRVPYDEGVREVRDEPRAHNPLGMVGHVLDEDAPLAGFEDLG